MCGTIRKNTDYHSHRPLVTKISSKITPLLIRSIPHSYATISTHTSLSTPVGTRLIAPRVL
jgi:hypothetical protein